MASLPNEPDPGFYLRVVQRGWRLILAMTVAGVLVGVGAYAFVPHSYTATAAIQVSRGGLSATSIVGERVTNGTVNLDTEAQLVTSSEVVNRAASAGNIGFDAETVADHVSITVPPNTSVMDVSVTASSPRQAQLGAGALAQAYLDNRNDVEQEVVDQTLTRFRKQLRALRRDQGAAREALVTADPAESADLEAKIAATATKVTTIVQEMSALEGAVASPGRIVDQPREPSGPSSPDPVILVGSAMSVGLLLGLLAAAYIERFRPRMRDADDVERELKLPVLSVISRPERTRSYARLSRRITPKGGSTVRVVGAGDDAVRVTKRRLAALQPGADDTMIRTAAPEPSASRSGTPTVVVVVAGKERAPDVRASLRRYEEDDLDVLGVVLHAPVPEGSGDTDAYFADEDGEGSTGPRAVAS